MTVDEYEYCVVYISCPNLDENPRLVRTQWGSFATARIFYSYATDESQSPRVLRRLKAGQEEEITMNA